ncbi:hypothetical protein GO491_03210 [Flavobacteriaceae bacterium Ap0902]|nr:hypothetical protein [Flavobacteriaceae bacterium Ap0902]
MTKRERLAKRNKAVRDAFDKLVQKYPQWRVDAIISKIEERYFIAPRTIEAIIKREKGYEY